MVNTSPRNVVVNGAVGPGENAGSPPVRVGVHVSDILIRVRAQTAEIRGDEYTGVLRAPVSIWTLYVRTYSFTQRLLI